MTAERTSRRLTLEMDAEVLVAHQLDLIAQLEQQLRAVHRTMRQIERLRASRRRAGQELSNGEKNNTLRHLTEELTAIDRELNTQHESCVEMQLTVDKMRARLRDMRAGAAPASADARQSPHEPPA
jgi:chaperonin cofactor prefoldin